VHAVLLLLLLLLLLSGVGKTAIVEGLAQRIVAGDVPPGLLGAALLELDLAALAAGCMMPGEFEVCSLGFSSSCFISLCFSSLGFNIQQSHSTSVCWACNGVSTAAAGAGLD
jgi:hypothetical protein